MAANIEPVDHAEDHLGVLTPGMGHPYLVSLFSGMEAAAKVKGKQLDYGSYDQRNVHHSDAIKAFVNPRTVQGILVVLPDQILQPALAELHKDGFPFVVVSDRSFQDIATCLVVDNNHGAYLATHHLIQKGHKRIGLVMGDPIRQDTDERHQGYLRALREAKMKPDPDLLFQGNFNVSSGMKAGNEYLGMANPPTAVFAMNDMMAAGVLTALKNAGKQGKMDVVGFDDIPLASIFVPPITTIAYDLPKLGRMSVEKLLQIIATKESEPSVVELETRLVVRKSA